MNNTITRMARPLVAAGILLLAAHGASAVELTEGQQYKLLKPAQPTDVAPGKVQVVEVFWYACSHCFAIEPKIEAWNSKGKPPYVVSVQMPATWNELLKTHARVFYTAELLGKLQQLNGDIFREINVKGNRMDTPEKIEAFFVSHGVSKADFQKAFSSFAVESKLRQAEEMNKRYKITGTPTWVVDGKYVTDVSMAGSEDALFEVLNALAAKAKQ
ncbi:MAG: thiol:disulfide interchange protein DsbA/DsbL [Steroidobacteraceae bacterium]|nr:thiol:disulfide interchange protein DsbA/DsbL [Steroidobacteraceae bacterium]